MDNSFLIKLGLDTQKLVEGVNRSNSILDNFSSKVMGVASTLGVAFSVQQVSSFAIEITKLAGVADGVRQAFTKLENSTAVLQQMRQATNGTVSDLDLMKSAVQASNFNIPIQQLGKLFEFAYERAKATGQSVDYLVNSIVVGIGRKSPLILDNLGISAVQLKEKLGGVSTEAATVGQVAEAVGKIATASLEATGKSAETAAEKISQIGANWENVKEKMGTGAALLLGPLLDGLNTLTGGVNESQAQMESLIYEFGRAGDIAGNLNKINLWAERLGVNLKTLQSDSPVISKMITQINELNKALDEELHGPTGVGGSRDSKKKNTDTIEQLGLIQKINAEIKRLGEERDKAFGSKALDSIEKYNKKIKELKDGLEFINNLGNKKPLPRIPMGWDTTINTPSIAEMSNMLGSGMNGPLGLGDKSRAELLQTAQTMETVQERADRLSHSLKMGLTDAFVSAGMAMGQFFSGVNVNAGAVGLEALGNIAVQLGGLLIAQGIAVEAFKQSLATLNGGAAIAAGVALVAAGSAFKAAAANIASSGGSGAYGGSAPPMARPSDQRLQGEFIVRGADLVYVLNKQGYRQSVVGG